MEERKKILELLQNGKINADDAVKLLEALNKSYGPFGVMRFTGPHLRKMMKKKMHKHGFGHHFDPGRKKVIVKMVGDCDCDPEDADIICCD